MEKSFMSEIVATFDPFNEQLDYDKTLKRVRQSLNNSDDGELYLERTRGESISFDDRKLRNASYNATQGFGLRAISGEVIGYSHSSNISEKAINDASKTIASVGSVSPVATQAPERTFKKLYSSDDPMISIPFNQKIEVLKAIDDYARTLDKRVVQVSASFGASIQELKILRVDGNLTSDTRPMARISINVIVECNGRRESGSSGAGGRFDLKLLLEPQSWKKHVKEALRIASLNLKSVPAPAGVMDVVLGPGWPGVLLHEAVGHGLEGDFNRKKTSAFSTLFLDTCEQQYL